MDVVVVAFSAIVCVVYVQRWVQAFQSDRFHVCVSTNDGVECQNRALKHDCLVSMRNRTLSDLMTVIVDKLLPDAFQKYEWFGVYVHYVRLGLI